MSGVTPGFVVVSWFLLSFWMPTLTEAAVREHERLTSGGSGRPAQNAETLSCGTNGSGLSWKTGMTADSNSRSYLPAVNFNKRFEMNKRSHPHSS